MGRYIFGVILIVLGVGFLLDQANMIEFNEVIAIYWPSIIILIGLLGLFERKSSKLWNLIIILVGVLLQLNRIGYFEYNAFQLFWPLVLIMIGINIIFFSGSSSNTGEKESNHQYKETVYKDNTKKKKSHSNNVSLDDKVDLFVMLSGLETSNQSQEFKGGRASTILGGIDLDLRGAKLYEDEIYIEVNAILGGIDIYVPDDWRVEISGTPILGGLSNNTKLNNNPDAPVLRIRYLAILGGIEIS